MNAFTELVKSTTDFSLFELHGIDKEGAKAYYFIKVDRLNELLFKFNVEKGNLYIPDYGEVMASGFGHKPPKELKQKLIEDLTST